MIKLSDIALELIENKIQLQESLPDIETDVNGIYNRYFKKSINHIQRTGKFLKSTPTAVMHSSDLVSDLCKKAHEINPVVILINEFKRHRGASNYYSPSESLVNIGFSYSALDFILDIGKGDLNLALELIDPSFRRSLANEFTEARIKGSIHHELLHWLDDTLNNSHIRNAFETSSAKMKSLPDHYKVSNINQSTMEIQAQMGNIAQLKNTLKDRWDELSFVEMLRHNPALFSVYKILPPQDRKKWVRAVLTRMHREGLLGKSMKLSEN